MWFNANIPALVSQLILFGIKDVQLLMTFNIPNKIPKETRDRRNIPQHKLQDYRMSPYTQVCDVLM